MLRDMADIGEPVLAGIGRDPGHIIGRRRSCVVARDLQCDVFYVMRIHLIHVYVSRRTWMVDVVDVGCPYP